uniref:Uncharacterized protein n=1 Tax=Oryza punctata TaxID=4537 RepID=A0A0E0JDH3_ORYPU
MATYKRQAKVLYTVTPVHSTHGLGDCSRVEDSAESGDKEEHIWGTHIRTNTQHPTRLLHRQPIANASQPNNV